MSIKKPVIAVEGVTKKFRRFAAVEDVSFEVAPGEVVGFVGVNGAGKTTTINMLLGFTSPSKGSVALFGNKVTTARAYRSHQTVGYASGERELPGNRTGRQYFDFVLAQHRGSHEKQLTVLIEKFKPQLKKKIKTLSRGNKQKIALVAAFASSPELVILDEPTSGLDPIMQRVFLELIERERVKGTTIFMSSHYLQEVAEVCTRVLLMKDGKIVEDLSTQQLEKAAGKAVRVVSSEPLEAPVENVREFKQVHESLDYITTFVYSG
ncbi:ABC transporter ATP-binding protein, partial [Candidatus Saccharibacteria bacterium]|nr:ABC transporter ATP-binding protein [Candidatus Saccharibacteria bacterium]